MLDQLLEVLALSPDGEDRFIGDNMHPEGFRVYGGQVLAQAVSAAQQTIAPGRQIHSQHAYFLSEGNVRKPMLFEVERARDGGSFSSRRAVASQDGKPVLVCSMSFQDPTPGFDYQESAPEVPPPESLCSERELAIQAGTLSDKFMVTTGEDLDVRTVEDIDWLNPEQRPGKLNAWMKTTGPLPDSQGIHAAMLTYFSDTMLLDACLIQHGRTYRDRSLQIASLDHAIWFHGQCRADEWLLQTTEVECNHGGRGLVRGRFFTREGRQVATVMQQGLMRGR